MLPQRGRKRDRHGLCDLAVQLAHQHPAALVVDPKHVGEDARMLAGEDLGDRGLVVEEREDRLHEHRLAVENTAQNGRERPHPVGPEVTTRPRLRFGEPAGPRPRGRSRGTEAPRCSASQHSTAGPSGVGTSASCATVSPTSNRCSRRMRSSSTIRSASRRYGGLPINCSKASRTSGSRHDVSTDGRDPSTRASVRPAAAIA